MTDRVPHTPEDAAIFASQMRRVLGWFGRGEMTLALLHACGDYSEPCPTDWSDVVSERERREECERQTVVIHQTTRRWGKRAGDVRRIQYSLESRKRTIVICPNADREITRLRCELRGAQFEKLNEFQVLVSHD